MDLQVYRSTLIVVGNAYLAQCMSLPTRINSINLNHGVVMSRDRGLKHLCTSWFSRWDAAYRNKTDEIVLVSVKLS